MRRNELAKNWNEKLQAWKIVGSPDIREISPQGGKCLWRVGFKKKDSFEVEKENNKVMDDKSGDDDTGEVR